MLVWSPVLFLFAVLWVLVSPGGPLSIHSAHGAQNHEHQYGGRISWLEELKEKQRKAVASFAETSSCFNQDAMESDLAVDHLKQINQCRVKDLRSAHRSQRQVTQKDLAQACNPGFYSPAYGKRVLYSERFRGATGRELGAGGDAQPVLANPREELNPHPAPYVGSFLDDFAEALYGMVVERSVVSQPSGKPYRSRLYDFYIDDKRFVAFLKDVEEGKARSAGFITLQDLESLDKLILDGKSFRELTPEEKKLFNRLVFDAGAFHAFTLAKAMSGKLNFGVGFNEEMTLQVFADALRSYADAVAGGAVFSSDVKRMLEDVGFFSLAYLQCDRKAARVIARFGGEQREAELGECFIEEVGIFVASMLNVFNGWGRAPYGITANVLAQVRAENAKWAEQNKGKHLSECE